MAGPGQIPGRYNLVIKGTYDTFDHQVPITEFIEQLRSDDVPDQLCVVGLENAFEEDELIDQLALEMDKRANDLEYQSPTIQFAIEGSFHRSGKTYDLRYDGALYSLQSVFGSQMERKGDGDWLLVPF